jgi:hypothetical protein
MVGAGNNFFQINQSMTAHHSGPGPDLSRLGVKFSHVTAWPQLCAKLVPPAMVEAIRAGRQPEGMMLPEIVEQIATSWAAQCMELGIPKSHQAKRLQAIGYPSNKHLAERRAALKTAL